MCVDIYIVSSIARREKRIKELKRERRNWRVVDRQTHSSGLQVITVPHGDKSNKKSFSIHTHI